MIIIKMLADVVFGPEIFLGPILLLAGILVIIAVIIYLAMKKCRSKKPKADD